MNAPREIPAFDLDGHRVRAYVSRTLSPRRPWVVVVDDAHFDAGFEGGPLDTEENVRARVLEAARNHILKG